MGNKFYSEKYLVKNAMQTEMIRQYSPYLDLNIFSNLREMGQYFEAVKF